MGADLIILGASARAAAFSALRAGMRPWCVDLFADADLRACCPTVCLPAEDYPRGFLRVLRQSPASPWIYTGGLENRHGLVHELSQTRPLWGNNADVLAVVRSPARVDEILRGRGIPHPEVRQRASDIPAQGRWLVKPLNGAGGVGIRFWKRYQRAGVKRGLVYFQEYIEGERCAAIYVGDGQTARLLGLTRQLVGEAWLHAAPFGYCGSIGPLPLSHATQEALQRLGNALVSGCGLRGLFGIDFILADDVPWQVEINPRYTASIEVFEHATGMSALALHREVFDVVAAKDALVSSTNHSPFIGKGILFAKDHVIFPDSGPWLSTLRSPPPARCLPAFADIPRRGERIEVGRPILTLFARADSVERCLDSLRRTAADLDQCLFGR